MSQKPRTTDNVVPLFVDEAADVVDEVAVGRTLIPPPPPAPSPGAVIDLSDRPKVLMGIGAGNTGKTSLLRWFTEQLLARRSTARLAAVDPENRELKDYFLDVLEPNSHDPDRVARWLQAFLARVIETKASALIDFGGGDTSLGRLVAEAPDLVAMLEEGGVTPVAVYLFGSRIADLSPLATLERAGFQPRATALVLNEGRIDPTADPEIEFAQLRRHSTYRAAIDRGAVEIRMPRLSVAKLVEDRRIKFSNARDGISPEGRQVVPLGMFQKSAVRAWLTRMDAAFAPIASWVP
jgi:hypothetical protein